MKKFAILSIDGGGIRGIIPGQVLIALEKKLQKRDGGNARIGDYFKMVAGTSTGAILAAAYVCPGKDGKPKFSAQDAVNFYLEEGDEIFDVGFWKKISSLNGLNDEKYSADEIERVLDNAFGETKLSELLTPTCLVSYDIKKRQPIIFRKHIAEKNLSADFLVKHVLRGSSAAPTYFEAARIYSLTQEKYVLIDGGMVANDPSMCAYSETLKENKAKGIKDMLILSLGTGKELQGYSYSEVKDWGPLGWAKPSIDIALEGGPQMTAFHMRQIASTVRGSDFYRIDGNLYEADKTLDNASADNLMRLREAGIKTAEENDELLEKVADLLIKYK